MFEANSVFYKSIWGRTVSKKIFFSKIEEKKLSNKLMKIFWRELNLFQIKQLTLVTIFLKIKKKLQLQSIIID